MPREYDFKAFDGKSVHVYVWDEVSKPLGMVQICHGMGEHALRCDRFARYLNENGFLGFGQILTYPLSIDASTTPIEVRYT